MHSRARLTGLDGSFLRIETPSAHMHVGWKGFFTPREGGPEVSGRELRAQIAGRLGLAPRFRQRLASPPAGLAEPVWVDDERFRLEDHVVELSPPARALPRERFDALCDVFLSEPLDRRRALWRVALAPRLDDGSVGLAMKVHHAMVDGLSAVELALLLLDVQPDPPRPEVERWAPAAAPGTARLALEALAERGEESLRAARGLARIAAHPRTSAVRAASALRETAVAVGVDLLRPAPESCVNVDIGPGRALVHHTTPIEPMLDARARFHVTLNDVALAIVAGALRELWWRAGRIPEPMKTMVPVSMRPRENSPTLGNRLSFVFIDLPLHMAHPGERLAAVHAATARFKREGRAQTGEDVLGAIDLLPDPLKEAVAKLAASPRTYNLTVSNVPGPRFPVYLLGCELREAVPVIPISDGHALSIGIFTYHGRITFSGYGDPSAFPELRDLPGALAAALAELCEERRPAYATT
jgi:diacylglycerol O-acyltransferase / wax synthase